MLTVFNKTSALNESGSGKVAGRRVLADHLVLLADAAFSKLSAELCRLFLWLVEMCGAHLTGQFEGTGQSRSHFSSNGSAKQPREVAVMNSSRATTQQVGSAPAHVHPGSWSFYCDALPPRF